MVVVHSSKATDHYKNIETDAYSCRNSEIALTNFESNELATNSKGYIR